MSTRPEPRYWPTERKKVTSGTPKQRDSSRNWTRNAAATLIAYKLEAN